MVPLGAALACASLTGNHPAKPGVAAVSRAELREALLGLSRDTAPWKVRDGFPEGTDLIVEWKIVDAKWSGTFSKAGMQKTFKIYLLLDEAKNTVHSLDEEWEIAWHAGIAELTVAASYKRGQMIESSWSNEVAFTEIVRPGVVYEYRFSTAEMKDPVIEAITGRGWSTEGALSKGTVTRPAPQVPQNLAIPAGNGLRLRALAKGVQTYTCQRKANDQNAWDWNFTGPKAGLYDESGTQIGSHYTGPTWELTDGSKVVGAVKEKANSPEGSIPWLLLEAKSSEGHGKLAGVTFIQRIDTRGGTAPRDACDAGHATEGRGQEYTAIYLFYGP
jgi:hypothetical protein